MNYTETNKFQSIIRYSFQEVNLLMEALTHSSYANERKNKNVLYNERLEFLGDSVLGLVISDHLFKNHSDLPEGELTKIRAKIVCEPTLSECAKSIKIGKYLFLGKGEEATGGRDRTSILADAYEALIGSIYMDGGLESSKDFIMSVMETIIEDAVDGKIFIDYKTHLQELLQNDNSITIAYEIVDEKGPDHNKTFFAQVKCNNKVIAF